MHVSVFLHWERHNHFHYRNLMDLKSKLYFFAEAYEIHKFATNYPLNNLSILRASELFETRVSPQNYHRNDCTNCIQVWGCFKAATTTANELCYVVSSLCLCAPFAAETVNKLCDGQRYMVTVAEKGQRR